LYGSLNYIWIHILKNSLFALQIKIENDIFENDIANEENFEEESRDVFMQTMVGECKKHLYYFTSHYAH